MPDSKPAPLSLLDKDERLPQKGETFGDVMAQEVKKRLAGKAEPKARSSKAVMDPEAAVRVVRVHIEYMRSLSAVNLHLTLGDNEYLEKLEKFVAASVAIIPKARLDEAVSSGKTLRNLVEELKAVAMFSTLNDAASKLLE